MAAFLSILLSVVLVPASGIYNTYVFQNMQKDVPAAISGPNAPIRDYARPILLKGNGKKAVLMVHGFSGAPSDFGNLPRLFQAQGYDVIVPLLPGHGRGARGLEKVTAGEWLEYVSKLYGELRPAYGELIVIGLSMGASMTVAVSVQFAKTPPDKIILMAPFFKVRQEWYYLLPVETYNDILEGYVPYLQSLPGQTAVCKESASAKTFVPRQYVATHASSEAFKVAKIARRSVKSFSRLKIPVLVLQSRHDRVTDYETTRRIVASLDPSVTRFVTLTRANHVLPRDCEASVIEQDIMEFAAA
ncbi:MAG TPA: alpha/beta fold hydrolase [Verrucomicrobiae bacterium]|jgi:carboxylesterase|nr:alpha/beta fold hydrolase [Verrucomicrobiae bacterium]